MTEVPGTRGYEAKFDAFVAAADGLSFDAVNRPFLDLLPGSSARVLDAGAGVGQNAIELARRGHSVVAVEPLGAFLRYAQRMRGSDGVTWIADSLPDLVALGDAPRQFDFILLQGVWHHLDEPMRETAMARLSELLDEGGVCALSLRHGPHGAGSHVFPTDGHQTCSLAQSHGLELALHLANQPSVLPGKELVTWTHVAFRKPIEHTTDA